MANVYFLLFLYSVGAFTCHADHLLDDDFVDTQILARAELCIKEGYVCKDCTESVYCKRNADGTFEEFKTVCTETDQTCFPDSGTCISGNNRYCDPSIAIYKPKCHQDGVFPHPFDCKKFYHCYTDGTLKNTEPELCKGGYGFDPKRMLCGSTVTGFCQLVNPCTTGGTKGVIDVNNKYYYNCQKNDAADEFFFPHIFYCTGNSIFVNGNCVDTNIPQGLTPDKKCIAKGKFMVPNCKQYNECSGPNANPSLKTCSNYMNFNPNKQECVPCECR